MTDLLGALVTDSANAAALAAAEAVGGAHRRLYGPLVIVGPPGMGKSALLNGIQDRFLAGGTGHSVELVRGSVLAELMSGAGGRTALTELEDHLRGVDLLLLDDIDTVARLPDVQAFLHDTLEARTRSDRETVVTLGAVPEAVAGLDARLVRALRQGTIVEMGLPGPGARRDLLEAQASKSGVALAPEVIGAVAGLSLGSVREYSGALGRLLAFQQVSAEPIAPDDALMLLGIAPPDEDVGAPAAARAVDPPLGDDEFGAFLSEVVANVAGQIDQWRARIAEAIRDWSAKGVRTRRLEEALAREITADPEPLLAEFARDVADIGLAAKEAQALSPDLAGAEVFRDPDQLAAARHLLEQARSRRVPLSAPLADLRLADLGEGASNRLALQAARAVVSAPAKQFNPLLVIGASGVGKTHLLHGIGNALIESGITPVACINAHSFLGEVVGNSGGDGLAFWRNRYAWIGAFLLDDLHLLAGESRAQQELLTIFDALLEGGRALVFTSGRRLSELEGFDARLLTRLEAGMVVDLLAPDRDVRLDAVKGLLRRSGLAEDPALVDYLAARPAESVRSLQGMMHRLLGQAGAQQVPLSPAFARQVLESVETAPSKPRRPTANPSGVVSPGLGVVKSREKMVVEWPDLADRLIRELR
ncbi:MAG: DnaA/Hda family protein [Gemmatimonadota bacterium]